MNDDKCLCGGNLILCPATWPWQEEYWVCEDCGLRFVF